MLPRTVPRFGPGILRLRAPGMIAAVWTIVAAVAAVQAAALVRLDGRADVMDAIANRVSIIPLWAIGTPLILRSANRFPVVSGAWRPNPLSLLAHMALGSLFIVVTNVLIRLPMIWTPVASGGGVDALVRSTLQGVAEYYPPAMVVYGVIVALGHAVRRADRAAASGTTVGAEPQAGLTVADSSRVEHDPRERPSVVDGERARTDRQLDAAGARGHDHLTVRQWNRVHLVRMEDIDWVEAQDNYVVVHAAARSYKGRERISDVEVQLDPQRFVRIHRSSIVQIGKIREVQPLTHGDHAVILRDGTVLRVARSRRQALGEALGLEL